MRAGRHYRGCRLAGAVTGKPSAILEAFGQGGREPGLDGGLGVDQPLEVLAGQPEEPTAFGAADGGEAGVAVAAAPVAGGELAEVVTGAVGADEPGVDEDVVAAGQDDVEEPVGIPAADDLLPRGNIEPDAASVDGVPGRGRYTGQQRDGVQHILAGARHDAGP